MNPQSGSPREVGSVQRPIYPAEYTRIDRNSLLLSHRSPLPCERDPLHTGAPVVISGNNGTKRSGELNFWYPSTRLRGLGTWSVPLKAGFREIKIVYIDFRMDGPQRLNQVAGVRDCVWSGERPALLISGPNLPRQPIPAAWLWH